MLEEKTRFKHLNCLTIEAFFPTKQQTGILVQQVFMICKHVFTV